MKSVQIVRRSRMRELVGLSLATVDRLIARSDFPRPFSLSAQAVGWDIRDIEAWLEARKAAGRRGGAR